MSKGPGSSAKYKGSTNDKFISYLYSVSYVSTSVILINESPANSLRWAILFD